jgi:hypothetical protein
MNEKGAPTPVALTRLRAPESVMGPSTDDLVRSTVAASSLLGKYGTAVDNVSAYEKLTGNAAAPTGDAAPGLPPVPASTSGTSQSEIDAEARRIEEEILGRPSSRSSTPEPYPAPPAPAPVPAPSSQQEGMFGDIAGALGGALGGGLKSMVRSMGTQLGRDLMRGVFGTSSRRRR